MHNKVHKHHKAKKCRQTGGKVVYLFNNNTNRSNRALPCKKVCCLKKKESKKQ